MRTVIQRVTQAAVEIGGETVGRIGPGLLVLLCIEKGDDADRVDRAARKIVGLRCFPDEAGRMNHDLAGVDGAMLVVSQFTLSAEIQRKGRRPGFDTAAPPEEARPLVERFIACVSDRGVPVASGVFGEHMHVSLLNDGPVTFVYEDR